MPVEQTYRSSQYEQTPAIQDILSSQEDDLAGKESVLNWVSLIQVILCVLDLRRRSLPTVMAINVLLHTVVRDRPASLGASCITEILSTLVANMLGLCYH